MEKIFIFKSKVFIKLPIYYHYDYRILKDFFRSFVRRDVIALISKLKYLSLGSHRHLLLRIILLIKINSPNFLQEVQIPSPLILIHLLLLDSMNPRYFTQDEAQ